MGGVLMPVHASGEAPPDTTRAGFEIGLLDAILARVRALAMRRLRWLEHLAAHEVHATVHPNLPSRLRVALLDLDGPHEEAAFYASDGRCRELTTEADSYASAIAQSPNNAFRHVVRVLGATAAEADLLQVCLAPALDPTLAQVYGYLEGDVTRRGHPTETLAARLCGYGRASMWSPAGALARWQMLEAIDGEPGDARTLRIDPFVTHFLHGRVEIDCELIECASYVEPRAPLDKWPVEELSDRISAALQCGLPSRIWLVGQRLSGRRTMAACVAHRLGSTLVAVDTSRIGESDWPRAEIRIRRQALLHGSAIAWYGAHVARACRDDHGRVPLEFAVVEPPGEVTSQAGWREERIEMPRLLSRERGRLWRQFLPVSESWPDQQQARLSDRYLLQVGEIAHVAAQSPNTFDDVRRSAREFSRGRLDDLGQLLECPFRRDDLKLPDRVTRLLDEFLFEARDRVQFWEDERVRRLFPRGTGLVGLMSGPPGTGKTMAAQVIAAELELDLYRIDLASTVNKYIGETAKNLKRLFARAADMNAVLLFDEADALFSRRTEVRDSHDRYANADTNYLLQQIEDYPGVALLATNKRQNIDEAFVRRIRYLMFFPRPDGAQRLAIWRQVISELAGPDRLQALEGEIQKAASTVDVTGAQIKNATLAAMFLARQARRPVGVEELRRGLDRELSNQGRGISLETAGKGGRP
jgi:hypothetical protein